MQPDGVVEPTWNSILLTAKCRQDFCKMLVVYISFDVLEAIRIKMFIVMQHNKITRHGISISMTG